MTSFRRPLVNLLLLLVLVLLLASSVVKATLNLTLHYELAEDSPPGTVIGSVTSAILDRLRPTFRILRFLADRVVSPLVKLRNKMWYVSRCH